MEKISYCLVLFVFLLGNISTLCDENFDHACLACHRTDIPDLEVIYFRYLQAYGSTQRSLDAMHRYLQHPTIQASTFRPQVLKNFGLHPYLSPTVLDQMLPLYFERYDVKKRIKLKSFEK